MKKSFDKICAQLLYLRLLHENSFTANAKIRVFQLRHHFLNLNLKNNFMNEKCRDPTSVTLVIPAKTILHGPQKLKLWATYI